MTMQKTLEGAHGVAGIRSVLLALAVGFGGLTLVACEQQGPAEEAGETIDDAAEEAGDTMQDAADEMEDATDRG